MKRSDQGPWKIGDLEEHTGLTRDTIHYYLKEGLLHRPEKTGATIAWYDKTHLARLLRIKALRAHSLPLATVRRLLTEGGDDRTPRELDRIGLVLAALGASERESHASPAPEAASLRPIASELSLEPLLDDPFVREALGRVSDLDEALRAVAIASLRPLLSTIATEARAIAKQLAPKLAASDAVTELLAVESSLRATVDAVTRAAVRAEVERVLCVALDRRKRR